MSVTDILSFVGLHGSTVLDILIAVCGVASMITALTPTPSDDSFVSKVRGFLSRLSVLTHRDEPGTVQLPVTRTKL